MRTTAWTIVRIAITAAVLIYVLRGIDLDAARAAVAGFSWATVAIVILLAAGDRLFMAWRWLLLVRPFSAIPTADLMRIFFVSSFLGSFLPAGVGGDAARAYSFGRLTGERGIGIASVVVDRWVGLVALGLLGCAGVLVSIRAVPEPARIVTLVLTVALLAGSIAGLFADRLVGRLMPARWRQSFPGRMTVRLGDALGAYRQHHGALLWVVVLSLLVQALRIVSAWVLGRALGIDVPFSAYWIFMPLNILVLLLPLSIGGFGLPQGAMVWTLGPLGVTATPAFLLSTLFVSVAVVGNLPGAFLYATGGRRRDGS